MYIYIYIHMKSTILVTCVQTFKLSKSKQHSHVKFYNLNKWVELNLIAYMLKGVFFCLYTVIFPIFGLKCTILVRFQYRLQNA